MIYTATITSQGQITIPAKVRKELGLSKNQRIIIRVENDKATIEAEPDIMKLAGSLSHVAIKNKSINEIIKLEKQAVADAVVEDYKRSLKRMSNKILKI